MNGSGNRDEEDEEGDITTPDNKSRPVGGGAGRSDALDSAERGGR